MHSRLDGEGHGLSVGSEDTGPRSLPLAEDRQGPADPGGVDREQLEPGCVTEPEGDQQPVTADRGGDDSLLLSVDVHQDAFVAGLQIPGCQSLEVGDEDHRRTIEPRHPGHLPGGRHELRSNPLARYETSGDDLAAVEVVGDEPLPHHHRAGRPVGSVPQEPSGLPAQAFHHDVAVADHGHRTVVPAPKQTTGKQRQCRPVSFGRKILGGEEPLEGAHSDGDGHRPRGEVEADLHGSHVQGGRFGPGDLVGDSAGGVSTEPAEQVGGLLMPDVAQALFDGACHAF